VDAKGRISVPPRFRALLGEQSFQGVFVRQHLSHPVLECGSADWLNEARGLLDGLDPSSEDYEDVRMAMIGDADALPFDPEGRIMLPKKLMDFTGISTRAVFVGMQSYFVIWEPEAYAKRAPHARLRAKFMQDQRQKGRSVP
jgi:MraZ protein